jgi:hypothetical protein
MNFAFVKFVLCLMLMTINHSLLSLTMYLYSHDFVLDDENILTIIRATRAPRGIFFGLDICIFYMNPIRKLC